MATRAIQGEPSGLPTLPPIKKGRVRKAQGVWTGAGELSLNAMLLDGETPPANVARINPLPEPDEPDRSPEFLLTCLIFARLPKQDQDEIERSLRQMAYFGRCEHAAGLLALFARSNR